MTNPVRLSKKSKIDTRETRITVWRSNGPAISAYKVGRSFRSVSNALGAWGIKEALLNLRKGSSEIMIRDRRDLRKWRIASLPWKADPLRKLAAVAEAIQNGLAFKRTTVRPTIRRIRPEEAIQDIDLFGISTVDWFTNRSATKKIIRRAIADLHPDRGGDQETFQKAHAAYKALENTRELFPGAPVHWYAYISASKQSWIWVPPEYVKGPVIVLNAPCYR